MTIWAWKPGDSLVKHTLSLRPVVFIGMISYSLYLWHWPLIVFQDANGFLARGLSPLATKTVLALASILLASLSWRFVEQPFREQRLGISRVTVFRMASVAATILVVLGTGILVTGGVPSRYPARAVAVASFLERWDSTTDAQYRVDTCFIPQNSSHQFNPDLCLHQDPGKLNNLLIGDSHAAQLWYGLSSTFPNMNFLQATAGGCKPTLDQRFSTNQRCSYIMNYIFSEYLPKHRVDYLLLAARWDSDDLEPLRQTLEWAERSGIKVVLFGPIVQYDAALPRLLAMSIRSNDPKLPDLHRVAAYKALDEQMFDLAQSRRGVQYVSYFKMLCAQDSCLEYARKDIPLQADYGHLTADGSVLVATKLLESGVLSALR